MFTELDTTIIHGMERTIIRVLLPGDMVFIGILGQDGDFQLDIVMVGLAGDFILIIGTIGDQEVTDMDTGMVITGDIVMELMLGTGPDIEQDKEIQTEMFIVIDQAV